MIVGIHQPQYLPYIGYFDKIDRADIFVLLDDVQFKKNEWQNRNRIKSAQGWQWFTVPVLYRFGENISEVKINNKIDWKKKHLTSLITNYSKSECFKEYRAFFEETYTKDWERLVDINMYLIYYLIKQLKIKTEVVNSAKFKIKEEKTDRLIAICKEVGADTYLSGDGARDYLEIEKFKKANIEVIFQRFKHPTYNQLYGEFEPYMSVIDLLFNCGSRSLDIIRNHREIQINHR